jgi:alkanesulfonate monooxygenase SsuD/methylene tetrahydromethanopterin reductase-like flavin-dependent oxidoreductase (luciferase family)
MAALAGRHGDGFNTQALHPQLAQLVHIARQECAASGRDESRFIVTVFAGLDASWLRADSRGRQMIERIGIDRLILLVPPPFDTGPIARAGRLLTS